jgi:hypothetical protein
VSAQESNGANGAPAQIQDVPIAEILRSPFNRAIDTKAPDFLELVESIRQHGVIQPGLTWSATKRPRRRPTSS